MIAMLLATPMWMKVAAAGVLVVGVLQVQHWWEVRGKNHEIATLMQLLDQEKSQNAKLTSGLATQRTSIDTLEDTIDDMNSTIVRMGAEAQQADTAANLRVTRAIQAGEAKVRALQAGTTPTQIPPGHVEQNLWVQERLRP